MKTQIGALLMVGLLLSGTEGDGRTRPGVIPREEPSDGTPLVTLFQRDETAAGFDFVTGKTAGRIDGGELDLSDAHLVYGLFAPERLTAGFSRRSQSEIVELGDLLVEAGTPEGDRVVAPALSIFHTLRCRNASILYDTPEAQNIRCIPGQRLLSGVPRDGIRHLDATPGHVHLLRIRPDVNKREELLVKLLVVDHRPGVSLSFRWNRMR